MVVVFISVCLLDLWFYYLSPVLPSIHSHPSHLSVCGPQQTIQNYIAGLAAIASCIDIAVKPRADFFDVSRFIIE